MWVRNNKGNIFVGNLPPDFPDERLAETFDPYGIVLSAVVARDPTTGARLRYGFVDIATERAMTQAITALHGHDVDGCKLNVKPREKPAAKKAPGPPRRPPQRVAPATRAPRDYGLPPQSAPSSDSGTPAPLAARPSQSQMVRDGLPEIEPPPRRDFEVVRRPVRRTASPNFQVERRALPRRTP